MARLPGLVMRPALVASTYYSLSNNLSKLRQASDHTSLFFNDELCPNFFIATGKV